MAIATTARCALLYINDPTDGDGPSLTDIAVTLDLGLARIGSGLGGKGKTNKKRGSDNDEKA